MPIWEFSLIVGAGAFAAGLLGSLTGLGGGIVIVPLLTLAFGVDIRYAIGASLISVIATSSGAAVAYVREGFSNLRVGMLLEVATTLGATGGALLAAVIAPNSIALIFSAVLFLLVYASIKGPPPDQVGMPRDPLATRLRLDSQYPTRDGLKSYHVRNVPLGFGVMGIAGVLSGLLGIGSGALKVVAMDQVMRLPFKVSTTTSNFMIGVTAAASAGIYLNRGYMDPGICMPTMLGVLAGSLFGARVLPRTRSRVLRWIFGALVLAMAIQMVIKALSGRLQPMPPREGGTDHRLDRAIGLVLRVGVGTAALVVLLGGILYLAQHGTQIADYHVFRGEPAQLRSIAGIVRFALATHSRGLIELGLLLLIATPIARVAFSVLAFLLQRDRTYVAITLFVLVVLVYNLVWGYR